MNNAAKAVSDCYLQSQSAHAMCTPRADLITDTGGELSQLAVWPDLYVFVVLQPRPVPSACIPSTIDHGAFKVPRPRLEAIIP